MYIMKPDKAEILDYLSLMKAKPSVVNEETKADFKKLLTLFKQQRLQPMQAPSIPSAYQSMTQVHITFLSIENIGRMLFDKIDDETALINAVNNLYRECKEKLERTIDIKESVIIFLYDDTTKIFTRLDPNKLALGIEELYITKIEKCLTSSQEEIVH